MQAINPLTCDCHACELDRQTNPYFDAREEAPMGLQLTCTCASRYVKDADHESDCDLWLIDEFWAGFLAWDWDREVLVPTDRYPAEGVLDSPYVATSMQYMDEYEWSEQDMVEHKQVQDKLADMDQRDRDIALTTDAFIERMMGKLPEDEERTWTKDDNGLWKVSGTRTGSTAHTYTPQDKDDWGGWSSYMSDRHAGTPLVLPNGVTVRGTSLSKSHETDIPDFALYLDKGWVPDGMAIMLPWRDYGLPTVSYGFAQYAIEEAYSWAESGAIVEVGCIGAHGRTGTVFACMVILADPEMTPTEAISYVRTMYCHHAIETKEQEWFVAWFHAKKNNLPAPEKPAYVPAKVVTTTTSAAPKAQTSSTSPAGGLTGDPAKPSRKARRGKRGGKRQQRHRNRMTQGSRK